jgi:hypothetical protein
MFAITTDRLYKHGRLPVGTKQSGVANLNKKLKSANAVMVLLLPG